MVRVGRASVARHLHSELAAVQHGAIHGIHGVLGVALVVEADEGEAPGLLGVAVPRDVHVADAPVLLEDAPQSVGRGAVGQVVHLEGGHTLHIGGRAAVAHGWDAARGPASWRRDPNALALGGNRGFPGPWRRGAAPLSAVAVLVGRLGAAAPTRSNHAGGTPSQQLNGRAGPSAYLYPPSQNGARATRK